MSRHYPSDDAYAPRPPRRSTRGYGSRGERDYGGSRGGNHGANAGSDRGGGYDDDYDRDYDRHRSRSSSRRYDPPDARGYDEEDDYRPRSSSRATSRRRDEFSRDEFGRDDYDAPPPPPSRASSRRPGSPDAPVWGQAEAAPYPGYGGRVGVMAPPRPQRKSRRGLWITLGAIAALLLALGGGIAFAAVQYLAPAVAAGEFCGFVKGQGYAAAYTLLSANLKGQVSSADFTQALTTLDTLDGSVSNCAAASGSNSYSASITGSSATVEMVITRATAGPLTGSLHLKKESGAWHVDAIDSSLLGASLGAVVTADTYCADLKAQQYASAKPAGLYALLGSKMQSATKEADFVQLEQWHDQVDGQVSICTPTAVATGGTDSAQSFTLSITRVKLPAQKGALALDVESGAWKIGSIDAPLQGSDLGAMQTGLRFCDDLASANYADAYTLGDATWWEGRSESQAAAILAGTSAASGGIVWSSCVIDASTLGTKGSYRTYQMTITLTQKSTGRTETVPETVALLQVSGVWKLHGIFYG